MTKDDFKKEPGTNGNNIANYKTRLMKLRALSAMTLIIMSQLSMTKINIVGKTKKLQKFSSIMEQSFQHFKSNHWLENYLKKEQMKEFG